VTEFSGITAVITEPEPAIYASIGTRKPGFVCITLLYDVRRYAILVAPAVIGYMGSLYAAGRYVFE